MEIGILDINKINDPVYILVIGSPGAGKNYIVNKYLDKRFKVFDVDTFMEEHNETQVSLSIEIINHMIDDIRRDKLSLIHIKTGRDAQREIDKMNQFKEVGFKTVVLYVYADLDTCIERDINRGIDGKRSFREKFRYRIISGHKTSELVYKSLINNCDYNCKFNN